MLQTRKPCQAEEHAIYEEQDTVILLQEGISKHVLNSEDCSCGSWNSPNPNQFMHQKRRLDDVGRPSDTVHINIKYFDFGNGVARPSDTIQNLILMHKPIRIHGVFLHTHNWI